MKDVIIVGGGLAGLINAILLSRGGMNVLLIEKKNYPYHKVCGEYISNEVLPFFLHLGIDPASLGASTINRLLVSSPSGKSLEMGLSMGGFGISRYTLDAYLYQHALSLGAEIRVNSNVTDIHSSKDIFQVKISSQEIFETPLIIGNYGKRSNLDRQLNRPFFDKSSPYIGVKYHVIGDFSRNLIALHNFKDGYCGISAIEDGKSCICYLTTRENLKRYKDIPSLEANILFKNPMIKKAFQASHFLYDKPEVINEISFEKKELIQNHILLCGDAAGMITPLCGNGMSMAIHGAKILSETIIKFKTGNRFDISEIEKEYAKKWKKLFDNRLRAGRVIQNLFGKEIVTELAVSVLKNNLPLSRWLIRQTHGKTI